MFVWNAIPSMMPVMSAILLDEVFTPLIVLITSAIVVPPSTATTALVDAMSAAQRVLSAVC